MYKSKSKKLTKMQAVVTITVIILMVYSIKSKTRRKIPINLPNNISENIFK